MRSPARLLAVVLAGAALAACAHNPDPEIEPETAARIAPPDKPIKYGDCQEALRRASSDPEMYVDRLPTPKAKESSALPLKSMPDAIRAAKYSEIRTSVIVDTLGHAEMSTFKVINSTHQWLTANVRSAVARWKFEPAMVAGCKVPRVYKYSVHAGRA